MLFFLINVRTERWPKKGGLVVDFLTEACWQDFFAFSNTSGTFLIRLHFSAGW